MSGEPRPVRPMKTGDYRGVRSRPAAFVHVRLLHIVGQPLVKRAGLPTGRRAVLSAQLRRLSGHLIPRTCTAKMPGCLFQRPAVSKHSFAVPLIHLGPWLAVV